MLMALLVVNYTVVRHYNLHFNNQEIKRNNIVAQVSSEFFLFILRIYHCYYLRQSLFNMYN